VLWFYLLICYHYSPITQVWASVPCVSGSTVTCSIVMYGTVSNQQTD